MTKTLFAAVAGAALLAIPLAASAGSGYNGQNFDRGERGGFQRGPGGGGPSAGAPAPQAQPQGQTRDFGQRGGDRFQGRGNVAPQAQPQAQGRDFGQGGRAPQFQGRGEDRREFGGRGVERRDNDRGRGGGFDNRRFDRDDNRNFGRGGYGYREVRPAYGRGGYGNGYGGYYRGYTSSRWIIGGFLPRTYWNSFADPYGYGLEPAPWGYHWVVVDGEALLIHDRTGEIVEAVPLY